MSDLLTGGAPSGAPGGSRAQNGGTRATAAAASTGSTTPGQTRFRTPTVVMAERRAREARREQEAAQRRTQEEEIRRQQTENVVGVGDDRRQTSGRAPLTEIQTGTAPVSSGVTVSRRRTENIPTTNGAVPRTGATANPSQPRPVSAQQQQPVDAGTTGQINKNRTEAFEKLSMPATAGSKPTQPQGTNYPPPPPTTQPTARAGFPHAFERWETLSSHWEGLTSYWIRRLESNTEELAGKPIDQQMARQITDLSAAGANLFHAVVELQRLRASSERKFQRWFFETRNEQEQAQERVAELERQLRHERENPSINNASIETAKAEKAKAEELVREMRRELQISKEEARRAWEELGRREQEERERTIALRSGEPTLIGGVQVVPMAGISSRHISAASRPQTRGGPIPGAAGPAQLSGQQPQPEPREAFSRSQTTLESPEREQAQFSYQPGQTSPTETDPFTETSWANEPPQPLRREPDTQFYTSPPRSQPQPVVSNPVGARSAASPSRGQTQSTSPSRFYQGIGAAPTAYQSVTTTTAATSQRPITATSDNRSYLPSSGSGNGSEEEYHVNPDGTYTRDAQGRRIPSNRPISGPGVEEEQYVEEEDDEEDEDYTADVERERMYAQQYSQRQATLSQAPRTSGTAVPTTTATTTQSQTSPGSRSYSSTISASSQPLTQPVPTMPPDYDGSGYGSTGGQRDDDIPTNVVTGWENIQVAPRHHHPSRLSAILEERSGRTSPSRGSYASETYQASQRSAAGNNNNNGNNSAAAQRRRISPDQPNR